jgi:hypothetical protein
MKISISEYAEILLTPEDNEDINHIEKLIILCDKQNIAHYKNSDGILSLELKIDGLPACNCH